MQGVHDQRCLPDLIMETWWTLILTPLLTALYCFTDDLLITRRLPGRPKRLPMPNWCARPWDRSCSTGPSEAAWLRYARKHLSDMFPYLPKQPGWNKRLRAAGSLITRLIRTLAHVTPTNADQLRLIDSTPVECARSRTTAKRSDLAGEAGYGYCASHSRYFWGMRLYLVAPSRWSRPSRPVRPRACR
jgi:hypothetical protein